MKTLNYDAATASAEPGRNAHLWWSAVAAVLLGAVFLEAVFAGAMLSGADWARRAHAMNAVFLTAAAITAGVISTITLRRVQNGLRLGLTLLALATTIVAQTALGEVTAKGANLLWLHVPLGVALVALAAHAVTAARRLGAH